jgi:hypothetical protein
MGRKVRSVYLADKATANQGKTFFLSHGVFLSAGQSSAIKSLPK